MDKYEHEKIIHPDPDYASHNYAIKRAEKQKEENVNTVEKVVEIINGEFNKELSQRQNQIEHIEKQIHKTQKLLHLLRYVLISSHYNKRELEYNGSEESTAKGDSAYLFDQSRIHPALKKLLGKNTTPDFAMCRSARRTKAENKPNLMVENLNDLSSKNPNILFHQKSPINRTSQGGTAQQVSGTDRNRQKVKNRIIVGNISKWMPSYEDDNLTHKWMMYVRGPKENPDVSHFIEKVVFYLHPSYKPHDVVEVREPPFHLSRRGWGEFPIRVQIHFKCTLNKPVDIVHNLKLDKTYSGRQTLGNESIIDLYLYDDNITVIKTEASNEDLTTVKQEQKEETRKHEIVACTDICERSEFNQDPESEMQLEIVPNFEHDYCTEETKLSEQDLTRMKECLSFEHSYSYPPTHEFLNIETKHSPQNLEQEENKLIYGLDDSYAETNEDSTRKEPLYYRKTLVYTATAKQLPQSASTSQSRTKILSIKRKNNDSLLKKLFNSKLQSSLASNTETDQQLKDFDVGKLNICIPKRVDLNIPKFKNMGEVLPYLFKRLPLVSELAGDHRYKSVYPFTAISLDEYFSWNIAKQSSAEWSRAKIIKNLITKDAIHDHQKWNTKALMMYGRSHGYTPKPNFSLFEKSSAENKLIDDCFSSSIDLPFNADLYNTEQQVDIVNESELPEKKRMKLSTLDISDPTIKMQCSFIREEALECGIVLKNESIDDNVVFNGAERMIFEAVKCLVNHLVRRSLHHSVSHGNSGYNGINVENVQKALQERKDLDALALFRMRQEKIKYFFH